MLSINLNVGNVVLENGWDVDLEVPFVSILFHRMCSCAIGYGAAILAVLTRWRGGCADTGSEVTMSAEGLVSYLWESTLGENTG